MKIGFKTTNHHLLDGEDINFIKLMKSQLEKVSTAYESDKEFIQLIEDQLEEVDNNESDSEFIKFIEDQLETVELKNQFEIVEPDFVIPKNQITSNRPNMNNAEDMAKVSHIIQSHKFDEFQNIVFSPYEIIPNMPNSNNPAVKIEQDITKQAAQGLQDYDRFELTVLPTYETNQMEIQELRNGVVKGEDQYTNVTETGDTFDEDIYVPEEEMKELLGDNSNEFIQSGNRMSTSQGYGGAVANYGGAGGCEEPCIKYGFSVEVVDGFTYWYWLGSQAQNQETNRPVGIGKSMSKGRKRQRVRK